MEELIQGFYGECSNAWRGRNDTNIPQNVVQIITGMAIFRLLPRVLGLSVSILENFISLKYFSGWAFFCKLHINLAADYFRFSLDIVLISFNKMD